MEFNDLPLTLTVGSTEKILGLDCRRLRELEKVGLLVTLPMYKRKRRYTRESVRKFLRLGPEGTKVRAI
jgi:hypothetical protein|tara:strand:- start:4154 stop:4360 length:207 start_codon:yes stop_codon:yes gene_type:complete